MNLILMQTEREIILSVLKLTKNGSIQKDLVAKDAHVATAVVDELLRTLCEKGLVQLKGKFLEISPNQRLRLTIEVIKQGADIERACRFLGWKEFENIAATAFEVNNYTVKRNLHFRANGKRREIDLLAFRQPLIACVDCKHWQHGWSRASIIRAVEAQLERTQTFANSLENFAEKLKLDKWTKATLIPIVLSLVPRDLKFHSDMPIVSILQLQGFINELPAQIDLLNHFSINVRERTKKLTEF